MGTWGLVEETEQRAQGLGERRSRRSVDSCAQASVGDGDGRSGEVGDDNGRGVNSKW